MGNAKIELRFVGDQEPYILLTIQPDQEKEKTHQYRTSLEMAVVYTRYRVVYTRQP